MDSKSLDMLEFPRIRELLAGYAAFSASRQLALDLPCLTDREEISSLLSQSAEARALLSGEPDFSVGEMADSRPEALAAARGRLLDAETLVGIGQTLGALRRLRSRLSQVATEIPLLWEIASGISPQRGIEDDVAGCLTDDSEVKDSASPQLSGVRQQLKITRQSLIERLEGILRSPRGRRIIQEPIITERAGRYVIPVKLEARREIRGIVHDVSNTGATLFIEPWTTVEAGNELRELAMAEKREIDRILGDLSLKIGDHEPEIRRSITLAAEVDLALAKARFARHTRSTEPRLAATDGMTGRRDVLRLIDARHPLLGDKAVPLSVEIGADFSVLVITGPNTGGKTVALKTIGLLSLMAQAGLPIPASGESCLPIFDGVFVDIGDEQSIEQTLSTFSWHVGNLVRIIAAATGRSLVLLDELGTSTDPAQGSALARAILRHFLSRGTMSVATTHYGDLKAFAHATPGIENASLDFEPTTLAPTFHLTVGVPGGSNALATASRLGLPPEIIDDAREMLARGSEELESLLADLMAERDQAEALRHALAARERELQQQGAEFEERLERLRAQERRLVQDTRDSVVREAAALQKDIRQAAARVRKAKSHEAVEESRRALASAREKLGGEVWQPPSATAEPPQQSKEIAPGDTVWLKDAGIPAKVLSVSLRSGQIEVQAGRSKVRLSLDGVSTLASPPIEDGAPPITVPQTTAAVSRELHLLGKRADEAEWSLDSYLDAASRAGLTEARIVHGAGTGRLRDMVRDRLATHPLVKSFRPGERGEGGNGATIVQL